MEILEQISLVQVVIGLMILGFVLIIGVLIKNYTHVAPDKLGVFYGKRGMRFVSGGATFKVPFIERVSFMPLTPFDIQTTTPDVYSQEYIPVQLDWVALVRFSEDESIRETGARRFLSSSQDLMPIKKAVTEILHGQVRAICATMTVEALNANRDELITKVSTEVIMKLREIGLHLDAFTLQKISDQDGVLNNLGAKKAADAQRDATIAKADADREARERSAAAKQAAETAEAAAEANIAAAQRDRDVKKAEFKAEVDAQNSEAEQAGPRAKALAQRAVVAAEVAVEAEREAQQVMVEEQRILREAKKQHAEVVVPAEAERQAAIARAEGTRAATIAEGEGVAEARKLGAAANQAELVAQAEGTKAGLLAEAEGKKELAEALNAMDEAAMRLQLAPMLIEALPDIVGKAAEPFGNIDNIVMVDSGGDGAGTLGKLGTGVPLAVGTAIQVLKSFGIDVPALIGQTSDATTQSAETAAGEAAAETPSV